MVRRIVALLTLALVATSCGSPLRHDTSADKLTPPELGACRDLAARDLDRPSNASPVVSCTKRCSIAATVARGAAGIDWKSDAVAVANASRGGPESTSSRIVHRVA